MPGNAAIVDDFSASRDAQIFLAFRRPRPASGPRGRYLVLALATGLLGLASRRYAATLPAWVGLYAGDALWALLLVWLLSLLRPAWPLGRAALVAAGLATGIEFSQLCQWPWLVAVRHTWWGHLVLGQGFLVSDLGCYAAGIGSGAGLRWGGRRQGLPLLALPLGPSAVPEGKPTHRQPAPADAGLPPAARQQPSGQEWPR